MQYGCLGDLFYGGSEGVSDERVYSVTLSQSFLIQICAKIGHDRDRESDYYFERWM